jgi:hypothetical protein
MHTKFSMITGLCFKAQFKAIKCKCMVQGHRITKGAHHNRTNLTHFNVEMKTEPVFVMFGFDTSNRMECPEHCSDKELVVFPFRMLM